MDLQEFASRFPGCRWLGNDRFQAHCSLPGHPDGDPEYSVLARLTDGQIKVACFSKLGHNSQKILDALGLTAEDIHSGNGNAGPQSRADAFSEDEAARTADHTSNGKPKPPSLQAWKILVYRVAKAILEHDAGQHPDLLASASLEILFDGVMKDLRRGLDDGKFNPLPDLNPVELDEELQAVAQVAVRDFKATFTKRPEAEPDKEPEEKISALNLTQLYSLIDEWERRPWVWDGILPHSSLSLIVGKSETGKSTLIYSLIYALVTGTDFFGRQCEQGRVVYLAGDPMSEVVAGKIFRSLGLEDGVTVVPDALVMYPTGMEQLRRIVQEFRPNLIVGDTLAATVDLDVDKYGESYRAQMPLTQIAREFGPNFLMSHHSQKSAIDSYNVIDAALGSVGVAAVASSRMGTKLYRRKKQKFYTFEMSNLRIGRPLEGEFIIHQLESGLVELAGLWKTQNTEMDKNAIIEVLSQQDVPMAKRTLWHELRPKPKWDPFNDALDELFAEGRITFESGKRGGKLFSLRRD